MFLRGVGVSMTLPWMESLGLGDDAAGSLKPGQPSFYAPGSVLFGKWFPNRKVVGQGCFELALDCVVNFISRGLVRCA